MIGKFAALAAVGAMIAGPALAADASVAQLGAIKGSVLVSQNGKMVSASSASLKAGDRVVASANGSASVKFADGCVVALKPASMITVAAKSPCASGSGLAAVTQANVQQDAPAAPAKTPMTWGSVFGTGWTPLDYGIVAVGAIGAGVAIGTADGDSHVHPDSP
jgi:hypothetical protein